MKDGRTHLNGQAYASLAEGNLVMISADEGSSRVYLDGRAIAELFRFLEAGMNIEITIQDKGEAEECQPAPAQELPW